MMAIGSMVVVAIEMGILTPTSPLSSREVTCLTYTMCYSMYVGTYITHIPMQAWRMAESVRIFNDTHLDWHVDTICEPFM